MLDHKTYLNKFKTMKIHMKCIVKPQWNKLEIKNRKRAENPKYLEIK